MELLYREAGRRWRQLIADSDSGFKKGRNDSFFFYVLL
jgi:hypothetical protein